MRQHGLSGRKASIIYLVNFYGSVSTILEKRNRFCGCVFLDYQRDFGTISYITLLNIRFQTSNIDGLLYWIDIYLIKRL